MIDYRRFSRSDKFLAKIWYCANNYYAITIGEG